MNTMPIFATPDTTFPSRRSVINLLLLSKRFLSQQTGILSRLVQWRFQAELHYVVYILWRNINVDAKPLTLQVEDKHLLFLLAKTRCNIFTHWIERITFQLIVLLFVWLFCLFNFLLQHVIKLFFLYSKCGKTRLHLLAVSAPLILSFALDGLCIVGTIIFGSFFKVPSASSELSKRIRIFCFENFQTCDLAVKEHCLSGLFRTQSF